MINTFLHLKMCWQQKCYRNFIWRLSATNTPPIPLRGCSRWIKSSQRRKRGEEDKKKQQKQQSTFCATAENLRTLRVSSYMEAHWLTLTIMQALPRPQKKPCR